MTGITYPLVSARAEKGKLQIAANMRGTWRVVSGPPKTYHPEIMVLFKIKLGKTNMV